LQILREKIKLLKERIGIGKPHNNKHELSIPIEIDQVNHIHAIKKHQTMNSLPADTKRIKKPVQQQQQEEEVFNKAELLATKLDKICDILATKRNYVNFKASYCERSECPIDEEKPEVNVIFHEDAKASSLPNRLEDLKFEESLKKKALSDNITNQLPPIYKKIEINKIVSDKGNKTVKINFPTKEQQETQLPKQQTEKVRAIRKLQLEPRKVIKSILNEHLVEAQFIPDDGKKSLKLRNHQEELSQKSSKLKTIKLIKSKNDVPLPKLSKNQPKWEGERAKCAKAVVSSEKKQMKNRMYEKTVSTDTTIYNVPIKTIMPLKKHLFKNKKDYYEITNIIYQNHNNINVSNNNNNSDYSKYPNIYSNQFYANYSYN